jgi:hypothetical protein
MRNDIEKRLAAQRPIIFGLEAYNISTGEHSMEGPGHPQPPEHQPQLDFYEEVAGGTLSDEERTLSYLIRTVPNIDESLKKAEQFPDCIIFDPKKDMIVGYIAGIICPDGKNLMLWQYLVPPPREPDEF